MQPVWPYRSGRYLTRYERSAAIGERMRQLEENKAPFVEVQPGDTLRTIAIRELQQGVMPISVRRVRPDGTEEIIPIQLLIWDERA